MRKVWKAIGDPGGPGYPRSGDLLVQTAGASPQQFEMHNVLFVGNKLQLVQQMLQTREVVGGA